MINLLSFFKEKTLDGNNNNINKSYIIVKGIPTLCGLYSKLK